MSSNSAQNDATEAIRTLRIQLREDLSRFADLDVNLFAGYVTGWVATRLELDQLEHLVDELNDVVRVDGRRVLDRPADRRREL